MQQDLTVELREAVADVFSVQDVTTGGEPATGALLQEQPKAAVRLRGRLMVPPKQAHEQVTSRFEQRGYTAMFRQDEETGQDVIYAIPGSLPAAATRPLISVVLFLATVLSTLFVGAQWADVNPLESPLSLLAGWPFALSLLSILLAHELGHFVVARYYGTAVSLPYFIPLPLPPFGTMGAFINMKAPPKNRRVLLAIAAAGPLAGFVLAVPILTLGLVLSEVTRIPLNQPVIMEGNSLLYAGLKVLLFGRFLPSGGYDVFLHPVALAGWAGLLVTGLNLIPAGQLDGGHIVYALIGGRSRALTWVIIAALVGLGFMWQGWFLWAFLIFVLGRRHAIPLDDLTRLDPPRRVLAVLLVLLFVLVFVPVPLRFMP